MSNSNSIVEKKKRLLVVGVCGGTGSGKTGLCERLIETLPTTINGSVLSMDCFYKPLNETQLRLALQSKYDFDHPNALDIDRFENVVRSIKNREVVGIKDYDFITHTLTKDVKHTYDGAKLDVIFVEGIHTFQRPDLYDIRIFVDVDSDERLSRRIKRDTMHRGRTVQQVLEEWDKFVKPNYDNIISSTKRFADVIVPRGSQNTVCVNMIKSHILEML
jgi:uridine kinase